MVSGWRGAQPTMSGSPVWIDPDRPRRNHQRRTRHGLAPTGGRTGWDDDDPGTARKSIAHARPAIERCRAGATRNQRCRDHRFGSTRDRRCRNHQRRARHGLAPTGGRTGWDDDDPGTARKSIAHARPAIRTVPGWRDAQPTMSGSPVWIDPRPALSESSTAGEAWPRPYGWPDRMGCGGSRNRRG